MTILMVVCVYAYVCIQYIAVYKRRRYVFLGQVNSSVTVRYLS